MRFYFVIPQALSHLLPYDFGAFRNYSERPFCVDTRIFSDEARDLHLSKDFHKFLGSQTECSNTHAVHHKKLHKATIWTCIPRTHSNLENNLYISTRVVWGQVPCPVMYGGSLHHAHVVESTLISLLRADLILQALCSLTQRSSARATGLHESAIPCRSSQCRQWLMTLCLIPLCETTSAPGADGGYANILGIIKGKVKNEGGGLWRRTRLW